MGVRPQPDGIDLLGALVINPCVNDVLGEDVPVEQTIMVPLQCIQYLIQRPWHRLYLGRLFVRQLIPGSVATLP